jgi:hypothetical protein
MVLKLVLSRHGLTKRRCHIACNRCTYTHVCVKVSSMYHTRCDAFSTGFSNVQTTLAPLIDKPSFEACIQGRSSQRSRCEPCTPRAKNIGATHHEELPHQVHLGVTFFRIYHLGRKCARLQTQQLPNEEVGFVAFCSQFLSTCDLYAYQ